MSARSGNIDDGARVHIRAKGFWNGSQDALFDVRVFYPKASTNRSSNLLSVYKRHQQAKKREYGQRIRDVERGVFTPLALSSIFIVSTIEYEPQWQRRPQYPREACYHRGTQRLTWAWA